MGESPIKEGKISRVFRGIRHVRQNRDLFRFSLVVEKLSLRVPTAKRLAVEWIRGPKKIKSNEVRMLHRGVWECRWEVPLILEATLFYSEQRCADRRCYHPKLSKIRFVNLVKNNELLGELCIDLGTLTSGTLSLVLPVKKSPDPHSWTKLLVKCERINGLDSDLSEATLFSKTPLNGSPSEVSGGFAYRSRLHRTRLPAVGGDCPPSVGGSWTKSPNDLNLCEGPDCSLDDDIHTLVDLERKASKDDPDQKSSESTEFIDETCSKGNMSLKRESYCDPGEWTDYVRIPKEELIIKLQRLESALKNDQPRELVFILEEELINTKVKLAQAESAKDELMEAARMTISELSATVEDNAKVLSELEHQLTLLKLSNHRRKVPPSTSVRLKKLVKDRIQAGKKAVGKETVMPPSTSRASDPS